MRIPEVPFGARLILGFAAMGSLAGISHGLIGAAVGAFIAGTVAAIGCWIFSGS